MSIRAKELRIAIDSGGVSFLDLEGKQATEMALAYTA
jgi:hypothetical protein